MNRLRREDARNVGRVLVVDDHARARQSTVDALAAAGHDVASSASAREALATLDDGEFDVVITDLKMPGMDGIEFIRAIEKRDDDVQIVMMTAFASVATAVEAMRHGAFDYIEKPFDADRLESLVGRALSHGAVVGRRSRMPTNGRALPAMIGDSQAMLSLKQRIEQVAATDVTLLISGESGTGKELVAQSIHAASRRAAGPLVSLNCPALSPQLLESELFGHERGAFTSAEAPRVGRFELADQGTIFLDEVTEIDLGLQAKLLRVLQEKTFERVGSNETKRIDVRVLATTNRDLRTAVEKGKFREDLYFRLAVVPLHVPPLRQRRGDIVTLAVHFLARMIERVERVPGGFDDAALDLLVNYHWPGNVRELENLMTRAAVLCTGELVRADDLRPWLIDADGSEIAPGGHIAARVPVGMSLQEMEKTMIEATLERFDGHRTRRHEPLASAFAR